MTCDVCRHDYWPHAHCPDCHRSWFGLEQCHCVVCHQTFASDEVFLRHQTDGGCVDPGTILRKDGTPRFERVDRKGGPVWVRRDDRPRPHVTPRDGGGPLGDVGMPCPARTSGVAL